jgi:hypothetical protein
MYNIYIGKRLKRAASLTHTNKQTNKQTNRLGQKTPLIKVSYSKQRPKVKHFLGISIIGV